MTAPERLPKNTESEVPAENADLIKQVAEGAASFLQIDLATASPAEIVEKVDDYVHRMQKKSAPAPEGEQVEIFFGCLWGEQLVREFQWEWANVTFHEHSNVDALGVFSPDRSLAIYPFHFIIGCLECDAPVTIALAYNLLKDGARIPDLPPRGFENVMDNVHHAVPRD